MGALINRNLFRFGVLVFVLLIWSGCSGDEGAEEGATTTASPTTAALTTTTPPTTTVPTSTLPPVSGNDPSSRVVAFYYPWYSNPEFPVERGPWVHWDQAGNTPPTNIGSDFYPLLGAYSAIDPEVIAQHFAWLRNAGVGVIATSWWGQGSQEDEAVAALLDGAERNGIQVAFHIEPYSGRTADTLVGDVEYLYESYGGHPAFYRSTETTRWSDDDHAKGLFFIWSAERPNSASEYVDAGYWRDAVDAIHAMPSGGLVIADLPDGFWIDGGHFDGLYQYATLEETPSFEWATSLPPGAWYIPSVLPGFSANRIGYDSSTFTAREGGATYRRQWGAALGTGIEPHMVTITSFNEWHEGTQIEPARPDAHRTSGEAYDEYGDLGSEGYLTLTAELVNTYLQTTWDSVAAQRLQIKVESSSDWTTLTLLSGGELIQPVIQSTSESGAFSMDGDLALTQSLDRANSGVVVDATVEVGVLNIGETLEFRIERGGIGYTEVTIETVGDAEPQVFRWDGGNDELVDGEAGRNPYLFTIIP